VKTTSTRRSRRHRNPHAGESEQQRQPFFSPAQVQTKAEQPFFQPKLAIGQPGDKYEQEADAVAEQVVNGQGKAPVVQRQAISSVQRTTLATPQEDEKLGTAEARMEKDKLVQEKPDVQLEAAPEEEEPVQMQQEEEEPVQMQTDEEEPVQMMEGEKEEVQMQAAEEEEPVQMKTEPGTQATNPPLGNRIREKAGNGRPLPRKTRAEMESAIGANFGGVNIHTDTEAVQMNKELGAQAFTHGRDVYFNSGKYRPESTDGKRLLAHELTHVVQQQGAVQRKESPQTQGTLPVSQTIGTEDKTESSDPLSDDDYVNTVIDAFPDAELKKQIGADIKNRRGFLTGMQPSLGTLQDVITHFNAIRKVNVPGEVHLHESAASRLEMVAEQLTVNGGVMPYSDVALGLRGRYWHKHNRGLMAHPCGYAIDFRPYDNPHLTDPRLVKLIEMQTGGQVNMDMSNYSSRRALISAMGDANETGTLGENPELAGKARQFLDNLETQFEKVSGTSKKFQEELPDTREQLFSYQEQMKEINARIRAIAKEKKKPQSDKQQLEKEAVELTTQKATMEMNMKKELPRIFAPWIWRINFKILLITYLLKQSGLDPYTAGTEKEVKNKIQLQLKSLKKEKMEAEKKLLKVEKDFKDYARMAKEKQYKTPEEKQKAIETGLTKFSNYYDEKSELQESIEHANQQIPSLEKQITLLPKLSELKTLQSLKTSLSDFNFVFGTGPAVKNPPIVQLLQKGFFNADAEPSANEKMNPKKHGFNLSFIKTMASFGFDLGIAWSAGSSDPMHFELVKGVDALKNPEK